MNNKELIEIVPILTGKDQISIRMIDWFVTSYCKNNKITINNNFDVFKNYKLQLKDLSKRNFDVFCRKGRIQLKIADININTSNGQVTFLKWALKNDIIKYIRSNIDVITNSMN